ncbi:MAG: hypothetical protein KDK41_18130, partial [Leptospiraceae bacterium]|nr:hypothetical protein [Leptospiraceae bacterium]
NCQTDQVYKVFQVIEKAALANLCQGSPDDNMPLCIGHTVLIPQVTGNVYYDDQLIKLKENECAIYSGTIEYETVSGSKKTVPVVKIIDARMNVD